MNIEQETASPPPSPIAQLPAHDYGAETLRNYRYQSAYAVVLLVAAAAERKTYSAVWCEQEDDILAQLAENSFDSYQVKTRKPELGEWCLTDDALVSAIKVFLRLDAEFPDCIQHFHFVSNAECLESDAANKTHLCPKRLVVGAKTKSAYAEFAETETKGFDALLAKIDTTPKPSTSALFNVLQRLTFVKSPSRESFIAELAQNHLRELEWCRLPQPRLETLVWALIEMVDRASSLSSQDSSRHLARPSGDGQSDPQLMAKRITVEDFILRTRELANPAFRYLPVLTTSPLEQTSKDLKRFNQKLMRGGLDDYAHSLRNQTLSAEAAFLDLATRGPEGQAELTQIENVVKAECDAAHLRAAQGAKPFGQRMLIDVQDRLQRVAKEEAAKVGRQPYEALMGMAGILTESCPVWWSEKFALEDQP
jgi:hypothetical protein